jgi:hypothetical protein
MKQMKKNNASNKMYRIQHFLCCRKKKKDCLTLFSAEKVLSLHADSKQLLSSNQITFK